MPTILECFNKQGEKVGELDISGMSVRQIEIEKDIQEFQGRTYRVVEPYKWEEFK